MKQYLSVDAGGTFTKYAFMSEDGEILEKGQFETPDYRRYGLEDFLTLLDTAINRYLGQVHGLALSMPGMIDSRNGRSISGGNLPYFCGVKVRELLEERYGLPVTAENDGKCAALAELWRGSLAGCENGAVLVIGTAVAGGLILGGRLHRGRHFSAGEYSFLAVDTEHLDTAMSYFGKRGGVGALAARVAERTGEKAASLDGLSIFERANRGEKAVLFGLRAYTDALAVQIFNLNMLLDLEKIAVGGGISRQPLLLQYLKESVARVVERHPYRELSPFIPEPQVCACKFYSDANLIGAFYHHKTMRGE